MEALKLEPGNEDALLILADVARSKEEIALAEEMLKKSAGRETVKLHLTAATLDLRKGDLPAMEAELKRAIAFDPNAQVAYLSLARYHLSQNDRESAEKEFKLAIDLAPPRAPAQLMYSEFKAQSGASDEAIAHLDEVLKKAPDYLPAWILLSKLTAPKDTQKALTLLDNVFRRDNQNFEARVLESEYYMMRGEGKKAVDSLRQLETNYPKIPTVKLELARALLLGGDAAQALTTLDQAIALAPNYGDAILLQAETNLRLGNNAAVVTAMEDLLKSNPTSERAQVVLADAYRAIGRFDDAAAILRKQMAANPKKPEPYLMLGVLLRQQKKTAEARQNFEKALELSQNKLAAANQLIELDIEANDFAGALQRIAPALEQYPNEPGLLFLAGKIYIAQKDWDRAEAALLKILEVDANVPGVYELLVSVYIGAQKLPQAVQQTEAFLSKNPDHVGARMTLALIYSEMKNYEKARDAYEKLLAIRPDNSVAANNLAYIYSDQLKDLDKARDWAAKARSADPASPSIADTFGWILYRQGDYKQGASLIKEAADKLPNQPEIQYHLGMATYMMGDSKTAQTAFEAAALSPIDFPGKEEASKRLALLKETGRAGDASVEQLEALLKQQPDDPVALARLAELYHRQGATEKAASYYEQAIKANPTLPAPMIKLAQLYAGPLGRNSRALELAKKAHDLAPADARTTSILGRLAFEAGNFTWSYSLLQESSRQLGNDPAVLKDFAWAAYINSKLADARQAMEKITKIAPDSVEATEAKTFLSFTAPEVLEGTTSSETAEVQQKLKEDPNYIPALMLQGREQQDHGEHEAARKSFTQILSKTPDFAPAQKQLAAVYLQNPSERNKAYDLAISARKVLVDDVELALTLGEASFYRKDYSRAVQLLQESNRKKPLTGRYLYFLGMSLIET
ncbi:MAG: tetratricopeptide repeat protein, partial [Verrucomicrobiota bacterium]|nr:tetratricopeptide repeat protein [Verrucomicrobiota bacterium]